MREKDVLKSSFRIAYVAVMTEMTRLGLRKNHKKRYHSTASFSCVWTYTERACLCHDRNDSIYT